MPSTDSTKCSKYICVCGALMLTLAMPAAVRLDAQQLPNLTPSQPSGTSTNNFQGSVTAGHASTETIDLSLDDAIQRGLKNNLGAILSRSEEHTSELQSP